MADTGRRAAAVILFVLGVAPALLAQEAVLEQIRDRFEQGMVFQASFTHKYVDSYTGDTTSSSGTIWVGADAYKVRAEHQTVLVDGETSKVYDKNRNRLIISRYEPSEDDFAPSRLLSGADSTYTVQEQESRAGRTHITMVSGDPYSVYKKIELTVDSQLVPLRIVAIDQADNRIITIFDNGSFIKGGSQIFQIDYPADAEIIDMRKQ